MSIKKVLITGILMIALGLLAACGGGSGNDGVGGSGGSGGTNGGSGPITFTLDDLEGTWDWTTGGDHGSMTFNATGTVVAMTRSYCARAYGSSAVTAALNFSLQPSGAVSGAGQYYCTSSSVFIPNTRLYTLQLAADGKSMAGSLLTQINNVVTNLDITFTKR